MRDDTLGRIIDSIPDCIMVIDQDFTILAANKPARRLIRVEGLGTDTFKCHKALHNLDEPCDSSGEKCPVKEVISTGRPVTMTHHHCINTDRIHEIHVAPFKEKSGKPVQFIITCHDITEQKQAEEALQSERLLSEEYINSLPGLFYVFDEQRFIRWNREWNRITGYSDEEISSRYGTDFFEGDDRTLIGERMGQVFRDGASDAEAELVTKDGRRIPHYFTGIRKELNGKDYLIGLGIDITERKLAEKEKLLLERQVQQAQKLESLGVLAGGVAHDFNNLLMGVLGNADLALLNMAKEAPGREYIYGIQTAAELAAELAGQMLAYSGKRQTVVRRMKLQSLVEEMVHLIESSVSKKVTITYDFAIGVPPIEADPTQIRQIIMNLVINGAEAIEDKRGIIAIRTGATECDRAYLNEAHVEDDLEEGIYSYLEVTDTGSGMDKETISKIFDPFFSTKFTGRGLGLAAVQGIVRGHNGTINVYSELGKGTTIKTLFPARKRPVDSSPSRRPEPEVDTRLTGKTVLLVDDEETVRVVGREMLNALGLKTITAENGKEALAILKKTPDKFAAILLDFIMPNLDGEETFREMRRIKKDIRVILSSGYNEQDLISRFAGKGFAAFIQKPYRVSKLKQTLLAALKDTKVG